MANRQIMYVGKQPKKVDNVLHTSRLWTGRGHVIEVPEKDAEAYLRHPDQWADVTDLSPKAVAKLVQGEPTPPATPAGDGLSAEAAKHEQQLLAVVNAIADLDTKNKAHFTSNGKPNAQALTEAVDFPVSNDLRDEAWALVQAAGAEGAGGAE